MENKRKPGRPSGKREVSTLDGWKNTEVSSSIQHLVPCIVCGEPIKRGKKALSGCCSNTCRKIKTIREKEEEEAFMKVVKERDNSISGRICSNCGDPIVGPNRFFCNACHARTKEHWFSNETAI